MSYKDITTLRAQGDKKLIGKAIGDRTDNVMLLIIKWTSNMAENEGIIKRFLSRKVN